MCTLTILPKKNDFLLTVNRDEAQTRKMALFPKRLNKPLGTLLYPEDGDAHGSWIAMNGFRVNALLNGAFGPYRHQPPYRKSRGVVLLDSFNEKDLQGFSEAYDFTGIAPFTIVSFRHEPNFGLEILRWDGMRQHYQTCDPNVPHIFSSTALYPETVRQERKKLFADFLKSNKDVSLEALVRFHLFGGTEKNPIRLDANHFVYTVSITSVWRKNAVLKMQYRNFSESGIKIERY